MFTCGHVPRRSLVDVVVVSRVLGHRRVRAAREVTPGALEGFEVLNTEERHPARAGAPSPADDFRATTSL